jgi:hypothetical protein
VVLLEDDPGVAQEVRDLVAMMVAATEAERHANGQPVVAFTRRERLIFDAGIDAGRIGTVWALRRLGWLRSRRRR